MDISKGSEKFNDDGATEINVETVNYPKPPGREEEADPHKVEVTHVIHDHDDKSGGPTNLVAGAAAKVAETLKSVKDETTNKTGDSKN